MTHLKYTTNSEFSDHNFESTDQHSDQHVDKHVNQHFDQHCDEKMERAGPRLRLPGGRPRTSSSGTRTRTGTRTGFEITI